MRNQRKMWRNGRGGKWTTRIRWYDAAPNSRKPDQEGDDIRLCLQDCERELNVYPKTYEEAEHVWFQFKHGSPTPENDQPFVLDLIDLLATKYPHLKQS